MGASSWQGTHVAPQKLSTIALPLKLARVSVAPGFVLRAARVKSGGRCPFKGSTTLLSPLPALGAGVNSCVHSKISSPALITLTTANIIILRLRVLLGCCSFCSSWIVSSVTALFVSIVPVQSPSLSHVLLYNTIISD